MSVIDTLVYMFETQGAKEASGEVKDLNKRIGEAEEAARKYGAEVDALRSKIQELAAIESKASGKFLDLVKEESFETRKKMNLAMSNQALQRNVVKDLNAQVKTQTDLSRSSKDLGASIAIIATRFAAAIAPLMAFKSALNSTLETAQTANDMRLMAQSAGASVEKIQQLGQALKTYGGNAASASAVMLGLNTSLQQMRLGQGGALQEAALLYGVKFSGSGANGMATPEEMLQNIAKRMESMTADEQINFGRMMGLDAPTIMMLQQGVQGLSRDMESAAKHQIFRPEDYARVQLFNQRLIDMRAHFDQLKMTIASAFMPVIEALGGLFAWLSEQVSKHEIIASTAIGLISGALVALSAAGTVAVLKLAVAFIGLAVGVNAALWPILAVAAAIGGIVFAISAISRHFNESGIQKGAKANFGATRNPISAMQSGTISSMYQNRQSSNNVSIQGGINIHTKATDSKGIAKDIGGSLTSTLKQVLYANQSGEYA